MSWYGIDRRCCGVHDRVQVYGPTRDRQRKADWIADNVPCDACKRKRYDALQLQRAAESKQAAVQAQAAGLVALTGSDKQVAWAESIRARALEIIRPALQKMADKISAGTADDAVQSGATILSEWVANPTAKWWIDNRNKLADTASIINYLSAERDRLATLAAGGVAIGN